MRILRLTAFILSTLLLASLSALASPPAAATGQAISQTATVPPVGENIPEAGQ
jgi:hypothetical protein